jgi:hypothetical protein
MSKTAMKLALEALDIVKIHFTQNRHVNEAITALQEALAEQPAQQDSTCSNALRAQGKAYPRTCKKCGLGPCVELAQQALDKMAENARELGLDYEPAQQKPVNLRRGDLLRCIETDELCTVWATSPTGNTLIKWSANNFGNYTAEQIGELFWLEPAQQEPVAFLANGTRFKISYDSRQSGGQIHGIPPELGGRWVAFVAADDDCHLKLTSPPAQKECEKCSHKKD